MKMMNFRRANSERYPKANGSPRAEVGEIDTRAPFQSVKAAVSLFGEVALPKERRTATSTASASASASASTPRKSRLSAENVIDMETQLLLAEKEMNNIHQKLESAESTKAKAAADLETAKTTLQDLATKLSSVTLSKQSSVEATQALKEKASQLELQKSINHQEINARQTELDYARDLYLTVSTQLDAAKQELNQVRQDFDAAFESKLAAFQQAAQAQLSAKLHFERVTELSNEISAMKEAIQQVKFATRQVYQQLETIATERVALHKSYKSSKDEAEKELESSRKTYDPELTKSLEEKLMETTAEVESLQEEMKKVHALEMDSVRVVTAELNEATTTLQLAADEECSLRESISSIRLELEEVKKEYQTEMDAIEAEQNELISQINEQTFRLKQLSSEIENARREAEEVKKHKEEVKMEVEAAEKAVKEVEQKLQVALEEAEEAKAAEKKALEEMQISSAKKGTDNLESSGKIKITREEFESLKKKVDECGNTSEAKIAPAMAEVEAINASKNETDENMEASLKVIEEIKAATEEAERSGAMAEAAQSVIEAELRRRRQQEQTVAS